METGTALTRAALAVIQHGAHIINMSFGEPTGVANSVNVTASRECVRVLFCPH